MRLVVPFAVVVVLAACSPGFTGDLDAGAPASGSSGRASSSGHAPSGSSSSSTSGSAGDGGGQPADVTCIGFMPDGPTVHPSGEDGEPAATTGGALTDGVYELDRVRIYHATILPVSAGGVRHTIVVNGSHYTRAYFIDYQFSETYGAVAGTYALQDGQLVRSPPTASCESGPSDDFSGPFQGAYTATATELTIVQPSPYSSEWKPELHYTKVD